MTPCKILIIDDDTDDVEILADAFKSSGVDAVHYVHTAMQAFIYLEKLKNKAELPKLIVTDMHLPGITGIELVQKIREQKALAYTPIIMLSTSDHPKDVEACYLRGANAYLVKPVGIQPLVNTLKSVCEFWLNCNHTATN